MRASKKCQRMSLGSIGDDLQQRAENLDQPRTLLLDYIVVHIFFDNSSMFPHFDSLVNIHAGVQSLTLKVGSCN